MKGTPDLDSFFTKVTEEETSSANDDVSSSDNSQKGESEFLTSEEGLFFKKTETNKSGDWELSQGKTASLDYLLDYKGFDSDEKKSDYSRSLELKVEDFFSVKHGDNSLKFYNENAIKWTPEKSKIELNKDVGYNFDSKFFSIDSSAGPGVGLKKGEPRLNVHKTTTARIGTEDYNMNMSTSNEESVGLDGSNSRETEVKSGVRSGNVAIEGGLKTEDSCSKETNDSGEQVNTHEIENTCSNAVILGNKSKSGAQVKVEYSHTTTEKYTEGEEESPELTETMKIVPKVEVDEEKVGKGAGIAAKGFNLVMEKAMGPLLEKDKGSDGKSHDSIANEDQTIINEQNRELEEQEKQVKEKQKESEKEELEEEQKEEKEVEEEEQKEEKEIEEEEQKEEKEEKDHDHDMYDGYGY